MIFRCHHDKKNARVLDDDEILKLVEFGELLEDLYGIPQDIEWAIKNKEIFILQSRPITTIKKKEPKGKVATTAILEGLGASPGIAYGEAKLVWMQVNWVKSKTVIFL